MKERPLLFSKPMVLALLDGSKTQTRRIVKPQPLPELRTGTVIDGVALWHKQLAPEVSVSSRVPCPYGVPGDRLWVKETWRPERSNQCERITYAADGAHVFADDGDIGDTWKRPKAAATGNVTPLFMPRWASRITLEVTAVRVERLNDISAADARAEGIEQINDGRNVGWLDYSDGARGEEYVTPGGRNYGFNDPVESYSTLWESINGPGSWKSNPWVWVVEFKRVTT